MVSWERDGYEISTDPSRVDLAAVHKFLSTEAYWSPGVSEEVVRRAIEGSIVFGVYRGADPCRAGRVTPQAATRYPSA